MLKAKALFAKLNAEADPKKRKAISAQLASVLAESTKTKYRLEEETKETVSDEEDEEEEEEEEAESEEDEKKAEGNETDREEAADDKDTEPPEKKEKKAAKKAEGGEEDDKKAMGRLEGMLAGIAGRLTAIEAGNARVKRDARLDAAGLTPAERRMCEGKSAAFIEGFLANRASVPTADLATTFKPLPKGSAAVAAAEKLTPEAISAIVEELDDEKRRMLEGKAPEMQAAIIKGWQARGLLNGAAS